MRVLVAGATGLLGAPVARRLQSEGFAVRALVRDIERARSVLGPRFDLVKGDVTRPDTLDRALEGCQAVYASLRGGEDRASYETVEVQGMRNLAQAARAAGAGRLAYISGAGRTAGNEAYFPVRIKQAAEQAIREAGVPCTIFRATHFMESLPMFLRGRRATVIGDQPHRYHYLAADDYAAMVARALRSPAAANRTLTVLGPEPYTMREALEVFTRIALPEVRVGHLPLPMARLIATLTRNRGLRLACELFAAFSAIGEEGDGAEAVRLLGAPTTTLEQWSRHWAAQRIGALPQSQASA